jgi:hypothetical protein
MFKQKNRISTKRKIKEFILKKTKARKFIGRERRREKRGRGTSPTKVTTRYFSYFPPLGGSMDQTP